MDKDTLSDVNFGDDNSILGALVVAGAAIGGIAIGYIVKRIFDNRIIKTAEAALAESKSLRDALINQGVLKTTTVPAPAKA